MQSVPKVAIVPAFVYFIPAPTQRQIKENSKLILFLQIELQLTISNNFLKTFFVKFANIVNIAFLNADLKFFQFDHNIQIGIKCLDIHHFYSSPA